MFSSKRGWFFIALHPAIQTEILEISYKNVNGREKNKRPTSTDKTMQDISI